MLTDNQLERIRATLKERGLCYSPIEDELLDDVATAIEVHIEQGASFEEAFAKIMAQVSHHDIETIQKSVMDTLRNNRNLKKFENRRAFMLMLSLSGWVILEYLIGIFTSIRELGPIYGFLSIVLISFWIYFSLKTIAVRYFEKAASFRNILVAGVKMSLLSSIMFCGLLLLFWTYIYPDFAESFQMNPEDRLYSAKLLVVPSVLGSGIATFFIGFLVSLFSAFRLKSEIAI